MEEVTADSSVGAAYTNSPELDAAQRGLLAEVCPKCQDPKCNAWKIIRGHFNPKPKGRKKRETV